jgi:signal transduction histidine kinase
MTSGEKIDAGRTGIRSMFGSVRMRIAVAATLAVGVVLVLASVLLVTDVRASLQRPIAGEARVRATDVVALGTAADLGDPIPPLPAPWPTLVQVLDANGAVVGSSAELHGLAPLLRPSAFHRQPSGSTSLVFKSHTQHWQLNAVTANIRGADVTVIVATSLAQIERTTRLIEIALFVAIPVLLMLIALLAWLLVGRALRPVEQLRREVATFDQGAGGGRLAEPSSDDEIARLARTLNDLLSRLDWANGQQRRFVADASHEFRSPVANIRAAVEIGLAHPEATDWTEVAHDVLDQNARMGRLIDDLLLLARAEAGQRTQRLERVDLAAVVRGALATKGEYRVPVRIVAGETVIVQGDGAQLGQVVDNLVVNAVRHAATAVTVTVTRRGGWGAIAVVDDGPGVAPDDRQRIFQRFVRLDHDRSPRSGGTGLGLAIVAEVVAAHGGTVAITDADPGAIFTVRLPCVANAGST